MQFILHGLFLWATTRYGMSKVKFNMSVSGLFGSYPAGSVADIDPKLADQWIRAGYCRSTEVAEAPPQIETASASPVRRTAEAKPKRSRRKA